MQIMKMQAGAGVFYSQPRQLPCARHSVLNRNGAPNYKEAEEPYLRPFVSRRREMAKLVLTKAFLQPAKAAMCTAPCAETLPPPPIPPFC